MRTSEPTVVTIENLAELAHGLPNEGWHVLRIFLRRTPNGSEATVAKEITPIIEPEWRLLQPVLDKTSRFSKH
jgi:hypothetical protein